MLWYRLRLFLSFICPLTLSFLSLQWFLSLSFSALIHSHSAKDVRDWTWIKHVPQKVTKQLAFTLHFTLSLIIWIYTPHSNKKTRTLLICKHIYTIFPLRALPTGKWIFWTSLKRLIAFIVSLCFAFINRLNCQIHQLLFWAFYLLWSCISAFCHDNNVQIAPFIIVFWWRNWVK